MPDYKKRAIEIADEMIASGVDKEFANKIVNVALEYDDVFDLMSLWSCYKHQDNRSEIWHDIVEMIYLRGRKKEKK